MTLDMIVYDKLIDCDNGYDVYDQLIDCDTGFDVYDELIDCDIDMMSMMS